MAKGYLELMAEYEERKAERDAIKLAELRKNPQPEKTPRELAVETMKENNIIMDLIIADHDAGMNEFMAGVRTKIEEMKTSAAEAEAAAPKEIA
jgi:hypothetical protein